MALDSFVGAFNLGTGVATTTIAVTGTGFTPKLVIFFWSGNTSATDSVAGGNSQPGLGWASGTTSRSAMTNVCEDGSGSGDADRNILSDACICFLDGGGASDGKADLQSFDSSPDGFTLVIDEQFTTADLRIGYLALGGADLTNIDIGNFARATTTGDQTVTGVGFQPDVVLLMSNIKNAEGAATGGYFTAGFMDASNDFTVMNYTRNNRSTTEVNSYGFAGEVLVEPKFNSDGTINTRGTVTSLDADGFKINWIEIAAGAPLIFYLALKGPSVAIGTVATRTDSNDIAVSGLSFQPDAVMFMSHCLALSTVDAADDNGRLSIGAFSATTERAAVGVLSRDGLGTSQTATGVEHDGVYMRINDSDAIDAVMDIKSIESGGFTCVMDDTDSAAHGVGYLALGPAPAAGSGIPLIMHHRKQMQGAA